MNTSLATEQIKYQQWAQMVSEYKASGLSIQEFCNSYGIKKQSYYYRLRKLREACLNAVEQPVPKFLAISELIQQKEKQAEEISDSITITYNGFKVNVTSCTHIELLGSVLKVVRDV